MFNASNALRAFLGPVLLVAPLLTACSGPVVLSTWASFEGANKLRRSAPHAGVDFGEQQGAPVLAAVDGSVFLVVNLDECGHTVVLTHEHQTQKNGRYTVYCHLDSVAVQAERSVQRGDVIGTVGMTGTRSAGVPHVHFELSSSARAHSDGDLTGTEDPFPYFVGCFEPGRQYSRDRLVLTYPVRCKN